MVRFMVLSAPRSASTWMANWLTTAHSLCLHDPLLEHEPEKLDAYPCDRMLGIACTALALLPDFVNAHPARKVIVHRSLAEVNRSLVTIGLSELGWVWKRALDNLVGLHIDYEDLFRHVSVAEEAYQHLLGVPLDLPRFEQLKKMYVEPNFERLAVVPGRAKSLRERIEADLRA